MPTSDPPKRMRIQFIPDFEIQLDAATTGEAPCTGVEVINLLTTPDLIQRFQRTKATIEKWRELAADPLPYVRIRGTRQDTIRFREGAVKAWARRTGRVFHPA